MLLLSLGAFAEPRFNVCSPWAGTAREWSTYDFERSRIRPMTVRDCGGISEGALRYAQRCMQRYGGKLASRSHVIIGDFSEDGNFVRLHVLRWNQQDPYESVPVLRGGMMGGAGNRPAGGRQTGAATVASDTWDSEASPGGCMRLFGSGESQMIQSVAQNLQAYRLDGLEDQNACAYPRGIFFHETYLDRSTNLNKVRTKRIEDVTARDPHALTLGRVQLDRHLGTAVSPGCINISNDDFEHLKASGIVPNPGQNWRATTAPRAQEGILFVSWFWGNTEGPELVDRKTGREARSCSNPRQGRQIPAVPNNNVYLDVILEQHRKGLTR